MTTAEVKEKILEDVRAWLEKAEPGSTLRITTQVGSDPNGSMLTVFQATVETVKFNAAVPMAPPLIVTAASHTPHQLPIR